MTWPVQIGKGLQGCGLQNSASVSHSCRLCATSEGKGGRSEVAERRESNGAASSSQSSSARAFNSTASEPAGIHRYSTACDGPTSNSFYGKHTAKELTELFGQRSQRVFDACPSMIPTDINLPEQVPSLSAPGLHNSGRAMTTIVLSHACMPLSADHASNVCHASIATPHAHCVSYVVRYSGSRYPMAAPMTGLRYWISPHTQPAASWIRLLTTR